MSDDIRIDDDDSALEELDGALVTQVEPPVFAAEEDLDALYGEDEDAEDLDDEIEPEEHVHLDHAFELPEDDRVAKLETAVNTLASEREGKRVRRKVAAATTGSAAAGLTPIVLQLAGALNLEPEVASAVATIAAALGALLIGYLTPERKPPAPLV